MLTATLTSILTTVGRSVNGPAIRTDVPKYHNIHPMCNIATSHSRMSSSNLTRVLPQYVFSVWGNAFLKSTEINAAIALRGCRILSTTPGLHGCMFSELKQIWRFIPYWTFYTSRYTSFQTRLCRSLSLHFFRVGHMFLRVLQ